MTLRSNHVVYRVVEDDPLDAGLHTWKVTSVLVKSVSRAQIVLKRPFPNCLRVKFAPGALGSSFFETPLQAIQHFLTAQQLEIEALERRRANTERAIAWAVAQEGMA